jgi:hypothetical protein
MWDFLCGYVSIRRGGQVVVKKSWKLEDGSGKSEIRNIDWKSEALAAVYSGLN